ncbi:MAG TPA: hypothetical protein VK994_05970, partial [Bacteroidales bacterium]|nr:hypothetical protein [Bacteroidales bacterium]
AAPISIVLTALKKLKVQAIWQVGYFLAMIILLFTEFHDINGFYLTFTIVNMTAYTIYWSIALYQAQRYEKSRG